MPNKRSRGEVRNSKLQKVAADLFLKRGYEGVTIDKIVELAGGSKSTVYSEFGGKVWAVHQQYRKPVPRGE